MNDHAPDELLERLRKVDPPPFLLTRIEARLQQSNVVTRPRLVLAACALTVLLAANLSVLTRTTRSGDRGSLEAVVDGLGMNTSNQLYQ